MPTGISCWDRKMLYFSRFAFGTTARNRRSDGGREGRGNGALRTEEQRVLLPFKRYSAKDEVYMLSDGGSLFLLPSLSATLVRSNIVIGKTPLSAENSSTLPNGALPTLLGPFQPTLPTRVFARVYQMGDTHTRRRRVDAFVCQCD